MTSLAAWIAVDQRGPSSCYIVSDSRISWGESTTWDNGRKLFASSRYPDIFGYCGDVVFPSLVLGQALDLINNGILFDPHDRPEQKHEKLRDLVQNSLQRYPSSERRSFTILHCTKHGSSLDASFYVWKLSWNKQSHWHSELLDTPTESALIVALGSGAQSIYEAGRRWKASDIGGTSRSIFSAFCESLSSGADPLSGGAPQLAGLYRSGTGKSFGVVFNRERYLFGVPVIDEHTATAVEWRNELFEVCDGTTMQRMQEAQPHARPGFENE